MILNTFVPFLIVICGATATGKSGLAIALAQRLHSAILSADSRQVYRGFDIGTAKPTRQEQQQVPHYLIDLCEPTETLTVAEYQAQAQTVIQSLCRAAMEAGVAAVTPTKTSEVALVPMLLVGGTGLYIRAVTRGLKIPPVAPQPQLRSQLAVLGQPHCYDLLCRVDPLSAQRIHANDATRTLRSLEVFYVTGRPASEQQGEQPPTYPILQIGLDCQSSEALGDRIQKRTQEMIERGLLAEVNHLGKTYGFDLPLLNTLGYAELKQYLAGECSLAQAQALTVLHTRQFAKRQRTWFRADPTIVWFDADAPDLLEQVWQYLQKAGKTLATTIALKTGDDDWSPA